MVTYTSSKSIQVKLSDGTVVGAGTPVPAGSYTVLVYDDPGTYPNPKFTINGPGVALSSDLNSTGMGLDEPATLGPVTFQTSSSYSVEDTNIGASSLVTFYHHGQLGRLDLDRPPRPRPTAATSTVMTTTTATTTTSPGPKPTPTLGTLKGAVSAAGKATLTFDGKAPKNSRPGATRSPSPITRARPGCSSFGLQAHDHPQRGRGSRDELAHGHLERRKGLLRSLHKRPEELLHRRQVGGAGSTAARSWRRRDLAPEAARRAGAGSGGCGAGRAATLKRDGDCFRDGAREGNPLRALHGAARARAQGARGARVGERDTRGGCDARLRRRADNARGAAQGMVRGGFREQALV